MFREPALVPGHDRRDTQGVALLAEQGITTVTRPERPDLAGFREVSDVFRGVTRPRNVGGTVLQRSAQRMNRGNKEAVLAELFEGGSSHTSHRAHRNDDVRRVGDFDAKGGDMRPKRAHAEGHDIHRATAHRALEEALELGPHLGRVHPVVRRTGVGGVFGADVGAVFDAGHVIRVGGGVEAVRPLVVVQPDERPLLDQKAGQPIELGFRSIAPLNPFRLGEFGDLTHPGDQPGVLRGGRFQPRNLCRGRHSSHLRSSRNLTRSRPVWVCPLPALERTRSRSDKTRGTGAVRGRVQDH